MTSQIRAYPEVDFSHGKQLKPTKSTTTKQLKLKLCHILLIQSNQKGNHHGWFILQNAFHTACVATSFRLTSIPASLQRKPLLSSMYTTI